MLARDRQDCPAGRRPDHRGRREAAYTAPRTAAKACERRLPAGAHLFASGDPRTRIYRVETGALCHHMSWPDGRHEVIEFLFPGDLVGFGFAGQHASTVQAVTETRVSAVSPEAFERARTGDAMLALRVSAAADREFEHTKARALAASPSSANGKVAAYLAAVARPSGAVAAPAVTVATSELGGWVSDLLALSGTDIQAALGELEAQGLVLRRGGDLLVIPDPTRLERAAGI